MSPQSMSKKERKQAKKEKRKHEKLLKSIPKAAPANIVDVVGSHHPYREAPDDSYFSD